MSENIFIDNSILKQFPDGITHRLTPILFAENGIMPASNNRTKKCIVVITLSGLYLLRPQRFRNYKISTYFPIFTINEIERFSDDKHVVRTSNSFTFFICDHAEQAAIEILKSNKILFFDTTNPPKINVKGYKKDPQIGTIIPPTNLTILRYFCLCQRFHLTPSEPLISSLKYADMKSCRSITLTSNCTIPNNMRALYITLGMRNHIKEIAFDKTNPPFVCSTIHCLIKKTSNIREIKLIGYGPEDHIVPEQLKFRSIDDGSYSFSFVDCQFTEKMWNRFIEQFKVLTTSVHKLSFIRCRLRPEEFVTLIEAFSTCRCFRTIEMLEIDGIKFENAWKSETHQKLLDILEHCRFLSIFSISNWLKPSQFSIGDFSNSSMLGELCLCGQDLSQLTLNFNIPSSIKILDLSMCHFTYQCFRSLFTALSQTEAKHLTLSVADVIMPEKHWETFFETLGDIPFSKCLSELDWSGNPLPQQFISTLGQFLMRDNSISYLAVDRIFNSNTITLLDDFLSTCEKRKLWGISIKGSSAMNISGSIEKLMEILNELPELAVLDISNQMLPYDKVKKVVEFAKKRSIRQLSIDGTLIESLDKIYETYDAINETKKVKALQRPMEDLKRVHASVEDPNFKNFAQQLRSTPLPASRRVRSVYFNSKDSLKKFNGEAIDEMQLSFPPNLLEEHPEDIYGILPDIKHKPKPSLFSTGKDIKTPIDEIQNKLLRLVTEPPLIPATEDMVIPDCLASLRDNPGFFKMSNTDYDITKQLNFEKLSECVEVQNALKQISETVAIEDEEDNFDQTKIIVKDIMPKSREEIKDRYKKYKGSRTKRVERIIVEKEAEEQKPPPKVEEPPPKVEEPPKVVAKPPPKVQEPIPLPLPEVMPVLKPIKKPVIEEVVTKKSRKNTCREKIQEKMKTIKYVPKMRKPLKEWSNNRMIIPTLPQVQNVQTIPATDVQVPIVPIPPVKISLPEIETPASMPELAEVKEQPDLNLINPFDFSFTDDISVLKPMTIPDIETVDISSISPRKIEIQILDDFICDEAIELPPIEIEPIPSIDYIEEVNAASATPAEQPELRLIKPFDDSREDVTSPLQATEVNIAKVESVAAVAEKTPIKISFEEFEEIKEEPEEMLPAKIEIAKIPTFTFGKTLDMRRTRLVPPKVTIFGPPSNW